MFASRQFRPARLALGLFLAAALAACGNGSSGEKARSSVQFTLGDGGSATSKLASAMAPAAAEDPPAAVILTLARPSGEVVQDMRRLAVYAFGPTWVSEQLELEVGAYQITQFLVVDAQNNTIYAAPNAADPNADPALIAQVSQPLPITFGVGVGVVHSQPVEVLRVGNHTPQQFGYAAFTFRVNTWPTSATRVNYGPGPDGMLVTDDDEVVGYNHVELFDNGTTRTDTWYGLYGAVDGRGPDGLWFTADDVPTGWWWEREQGQWGSTQSGPGADGIWVSDDDPVASWEHFGVVVNGQTAFNALYSAPGPDGVWFTDDDVQSGYYAMTVNENGGNVRQVRYSGPGPDGVWYTDDDEIGQDWFGAYVVNQYSGTNWIWNSWDTQVSYVDPGWDGVWFTGDDTIGLCKRHDFGDGTQYWTREVVTVPDYGQPCFGPYDYVVGYSTATMTY